MVTAPQKINALQVAEYFIDRANKAQEESRHNITNKKLQKLVYYAQVWSLVLNDKKLFSEKIEAWVHGPAVPALYRKFKSFEANPIILNTSELTLPFNKEQLRVLNSVWSVYGKYDAEYLEALTHSELPWQEARRDTPLSQASSNVIGLKLAKEFYARKLGENK